MASVRSVPRTHVRRMDREAAGRYVLGRHDPGSGYCFYRTPEWGVEEPDAPDTLAALRTLGLLSLAVPEPQATVDWLRSLQEGDGSFPTLTIGWATLCALAELGTVPCRPPAPVWLNERQKVLDTGGSRDWAGTLRDALHLLEILRLANASPEPATARRLLERAGEAGGGWARPGAELETTAVALLVAGLAGVDDAGVDDGVDNEVSSNVGAFLRRCEDPVLGLRMSPGAAASTVGALWGGAVIADRLGLRLSYPEQVAAGLALAQRPDGGLGPRDLAISTLQDTWLGVAADRLLDQCFDQCKEDPL